MKSAFLVAANLALVSGACSRKEAVLSARLGMSVEDYAKQDDGLAERMRDHIDQGVFFHKEQYHAFSVLHPHREEALLVFRDRQVELGFFADWSTAVDVIARTGVFAEEVRPLLDGLKSSDLDCAEHPKNTLSVAAFGHLVSGLAQGQRQVDPCTSLPTTEYANLQTGLRCHTTFEGVRQELELIVMCWQDELPSLPRLAYDFRYHFSGSDELIWVRPRYERKYAPLESLRDVEKMQRAIDERLRTLDQPVPSDGPVTTP